ncbi:sensor histidine kinase [Rufibacter sediminis]|uniref:Histidine kinase n=1 Tax=Rufibacter sediminis TaxID=2762756 RepID=A0ABR6VT75_9BACT|nr:histidine kinase [Rufibacter sediminis]MBC3540355.1 histidine kinase [Rufibacter sediminis]
MKHRIFLYHVAAWVLYLLYCLVGIYKEQPPHMEAIMWLQFSFMLCMMAVFYYCFLLVYPLFLNRERIFFLVLAWAGAPVVFIITRYLLEETLYPLLLGFSNYTPDTTFAHFMGDNLFRAIPMMALSVAVWSVQDTFRKEKENKLLRQEKTQAELAFLKSQVNPHFLYNTLNYIYALAYPVSEPLAEAILKLSDMMRYMLHDSPDGKVELQKEVEYLHSFIHIFRLRFEDHFFVDFQVDGNVDGQRVASLVLIPFVENAFKHGVVNDPENPVQIHLQVKGQDLTFEVSNRISRQQKDHSTGIGLVNIKRRLELLYPRQHQLTVQDNGTVHQTRLELRHV